MVMGSLHVTWAYQRGTRCDSLRGHTRVPAMETLFKHSRDYSIGPGGPEG